MGGGESVVGNTCTQVVCHAFFIDNLLVRLLFIIEMIWWTGLASCEFGFPFPDSHISTTVTIQRIPHGGLQRYLANQEQP